jgi:hypothetical protein
VTGPTSAADGWRGVLDGLGGLLAGVGGSASGSAAAAGADHAAECRTCPVCTALAVLRGQRPDLSDALADVLTTAAGALRGLAQQSAAQQSAAAPSAAQPSPDRSAPTAGPDPEPAAAPAPVQHIEVA